MNGTINTLSRKSNSDNIPLNFVDDLDIASNGKIYFSDASSKYGYGSDRLELFEHTPNGRLLVYDPITQKTTTLLSGLYFANGVALSSDESFVLVNETLMYRIQKYWLKGDKAGTSEIFIENLPGFPDNVSSNEEGIFWVALFNPRNNFVEMSSNKPFLRKIVFRLPELLQPQPINHSFVLGLNEDGKVVHNLQYQANEAYSPITSVKQYNDTLYFGSLTHPGWGKIEVPK
jgi:sugar lactone lactonase YvrE